MFFGNKNIMRNAMPMKSLVESLNLRSLMLQTFEKALNENDINIIKSELALSQSLDILD